MLSTATVLSPSLGARRTVVGASAAAAAAVVVPASSSLPLLRHQVTTRRQRRCCFHGGSATSISSSSSPMCVWTTTTLPYCSTRFLSTTTTTTTTTNTAAASSTVSVTSLPEERAAMAAANFMRQHKGTFGVNTLEDVHFNPHNIICAYTNNKSVNTADSEAAASHVATATDTTNHNDSSSSIPISMPLTYHYRSLLPSPPPSLSLDTDDDTSTTTTTNTNKVRGVVDASYTDELIFPFLITPRVSNVFGTQHGGAWSTLADVFTTIHLWSRDVVEGGNSVTGGRTPGGGRAHVSINLNVNFISAGRVGTQVFCRSKIVKFGRRVAFTEFVFETVKQRPQKSTKATPVTEQPLQPQPPFSSEIVKYANGSHTKAVVTESVGK